MNNFNAATNQRIEAKRLHLEQMALGHQMRLKNNIDYAKGNGGKIMMNEAMLKLRQKVPAAATALKLLGIGKKEERPSTRLSYINRSGKKRYPLEEENEDGIKGKLASLAALSLPFVSAYLKKRAFGMGLKGLKSMVRLPFLPFMKKKRR